MLVFNLKAQHTLKKGDIAFVAINSDESDDVFSFLLLADVMAGTEIHFTDNGWTAAGSFNTIYPESHFTWQATADLKAGTLVHVTTYNGNAVATASQGSVTGEKMTVSVAGDQILAYQGDKLNPVFIAAISFNQNKPTEPASNFDGDSFSNSTTALPTGLDIGQSAVHVYHPDNFSEQDNARFNCSVTAGTKAELLQALCDKNNWTTDNETPFQVDPFPCNFEVSLPTAIGSEEVDGDDFRIFVKERHVVISLANSEASELKLFNAGGVMVKSLRKPQGVREAEMATDNLPKGLYILTLSIDQQMVSRKVIL